CQSDAHRPRRLDRMADIETAAAQEEVRRRAMRDRRPGVMAAPELAFGEPNAMAVDRAPAKQPVMVVYVEVTLALRKERPNPGHLLPVFGDVRLHEAIGMLGLERPGG